MTHEFILAETKGKVGIVTLNRPKAMNALSGPLMDELISQLQQFDADENIGAMVISGSERVFAAGADIKAMAEATPVTMLENPMIGYWDKLRQVSKPVIAV